MPTRLIFREHVLVVFTLREAHARGYSKADVDKRIREKEWTRLCVGGYAAGRYQDLYAEERHVVRLAAMLATCRRPWRASSWSALAAHGLPLIDHDLSRIHLTRPSESTAHRHYRTCIKLDRHIDAADHTVANGLPTVPLDVALVEFVRAATFLAGVTVLDAALHRKLTTKEDLYALLHCVRGKGIQPAKAAIDFADGRAESPGESRLRVLLFRNGLPTPIPQYEIRDGDGPLVYVADLYLEEPNLILEYDGKGKFARGKMPTDEWTQFKHQNARDQALETRGFRVMHITSSDFQNEQLLVARIVARIQSAA